MQIGIRENFPQTPRSLSRGGIEPKKITFYEIWGELACNQSLDSD